MQHKIILILFAVGMSLLLNAQRYLTPQFSDVTVTRNVKYGSNLGYNTSFTTPEDLLMDVYEPQGDTVSRRPVIILGHAGSFLSLYQWGNKNQYSVVELCNRFAKLGYVAVSIDYRLGWQSGSSDPETREKTIINAVYRVMQDFKTCIRYFKKDATTTNTWKTDPCKIFIGGTNSGGYAALAVANLNKQSELTGVKFLDSQGNPYINQAKTGDFDGFGGTENLNNHMGYTSNPRAVLALGAATGDTAWIEPGEVPVVAFSGVEETTTPYNTAVVITSSGVAIIVVSGAGDFMPRTDRLGNNNVFKAAGLPQGPPNKNGAGQITQSHEGLYPLYGQKFEPWSWYDAAQPVGDPTLNPTASQAKAMKYIDTIMSYTAPRFFQIIKDNSGCQVTTSINELPVTEDFQLTALPVPAAQKITLMSNHTNTHLEKILVTDLNGRVLQTVENTNGYFAVVPTENLPNGMYLFQIKSSTQILKTLKVVVQH